MAKQTISFFKRLRNYGVAHGRAFKTSFRSLSMSPLSTLLSISTIGLCLALPVGFYLFILNVQQMSYPWQDTATLSIYMDAKSTPHQIQNIENKLKQYSFVEKIHFISAEHALKEFINTSDLNDVLELLPENPL